MWGYRGSGKNSALRKIESIVRGTMGDSIVVELPLRVPSSDADLLRGIAETVQAELKHWAKPARRVRLALESLSAVTVLGTGVERRVERDRAPKSALSIWNETVRALAGMPRVCICIDDAEML